MTKGKKRKKRKKIIQKKDRSFNKTRNVASIVYFTIAAIAMIFVILWYLDIFRL